MDSGWEANAMSRSLNPACSELCEVLSPLMELARQRLFEASKAGHGERDPRLIVPRAEYLEEEPDGRRSRDQEKALGETVRASIDALRVDPRRTDVIEDRSQRLEDVIRGIRSAEGLDVMSRIESLRKIGNAAAAAGDQSLTFMSMTAIAELSESSGTPPPVKKKAADAVQDIGERASQRMPAMGLNSDVIGEAIQPQAAAPVRSIFERRVPLNRIDHQ